METTTECKKFVLYLDIMGFKERVNRIPIDELKKQLLLFKTKNKKLQPLLINKEKEAQIYMSQFSDSIILVTKGNTLNDLNRICKAAVILMQTALETGFALRGVIANGEMVFDSDNQLFFGKALVDAYLLEEELNYYGVVFHESTEEEVFKALNPLKPNSKYYPIEDTVIPLKKGKSKHYHIAWHKMDKKLHEGDMSDQAKKWLINMRKTVSGNPRVYLDNTINMITEK